MSYVISCLISYWYHIVVICDIMCDVILISYRFHMWYHVWSHIDIMSLISYLISDLYQIWCHSDFPKTNINLMSFLTYSWYNFLYHKWYTYDISSISVLISSNDIFLISDMMSIWLSKKWHHSDIKLWYPFDIMMSNFAAWVLSLWA